MPEDSLTTLDIEQWRHDPVTKQILQQLQSDLDSLVEQLQVVETTDPVVMRLQEQIQIRKAILEEPHAMFAQLKQEEALERDVEALNPE